MRYGSRALAVLVALVAVSSGSDAYAQASRRLAILLAEQRAAPTAGDLATIRAGMRSVDPDTVRAAVRAFGRLERPALIPEIVPALRSRWPEVRAEAANAIGQAARGASVGTAYATLVGRLTVEDDPNVRAVLCETIGRLPYVDAIQITQAEETLVDMAGRSAGVTDRLGVAKGLEALVRISGATHRPGVNAIVLLQTLARRDAAAQPVDPLRDARIRRLALEGLVAVGEVDDAAIERAIEDPDPQVRRLAMRAAWSASLELETPFLEDILRRGLVDVAPMVRIEALQGEPGRPQADGLACPLALAALGAVEDGGPVDPVGPVADDEELVTLVAIDRLATCRQSEEAVAVLERLVNDLSQVNAPRGWHRSAHALVALAGVSPDRARAKIEQFRGSLNWPLRLYAAKTAAVLRDQATLEKLSQDPNTAVAAEGRRLLSALTGDPAALPGAPETQTSPSATAWPTVGDMQRLAAPRARVMIRGVGSFDLALFTTEAPATVIRFARLAEAGFYDGLTVEAVVPNSMLEALTIVDPGGGPAAIRDEVGAWPHVRGAVGFSKDEGVFIDLVDSPSFDHERTVFAQVLTGLDVIDRILEGDVIESVRILP